MAVEILPMTQDLAASDKIADRERFYCPPDWVSSTNTGKAWEELMDRFISPSTENLSEDVSPSFDTITQSIYVALSDPNFQIHPHYTSLNLNPEQFPQIKVDEIHSMIGTARLNHRHFETIVSKEQTALPSVIYTRGEGAAFSYAEDPQQGAANDIASILQKHPHSKNISDIFLTMLKYKQVNIESIMDGEKDLQKLSTDRLAVILRHFVINECKNAYAFYDAFDEIINFLNGHLSDSHISKYEEAAEAFMQIVYKKQYEWVVACRLIKSKAVLPEVVPFVPLPSSPHSTQPLSPITEEMVPLQKQNIKSGFLDKLKTKAKGLLRKINIFPEKQKSYTSAGFVV